ncbi:hypothetical protein [Bacillus thermotolerans]|uniref:Uncharacterized protein n=1 Tax=Bacillus thermotolerans TaxID=1221996 RepID=A0A0F5I6E0_BACTR|nr:hypothetical protein [Bacillus thermotolerans]KKB40860.1 hypothetical protein QY95_01172 [Bacillus thermotolerans]
MKQALLLSVPPPVSSQRTAEEKGDLFAEVERKSHQPPPEHLQ